MPVRPNRLLIGHFVDFDRQHQNLFWQRHIFAEHRLNCPVQSYFQKRHPLFAYRHHFWLDLPCPMPFLLWSAHLFWPKFLRSAHLFCHSADLCSRHHFLFEPDLYSLVPDQRLLEPCPCLIWPDPAPFEPDLLHFLCRLDLFWLNLPSTAHHPALLKHCQHRLLLKKSGSMMLRFVFDDHTFPEHLLQPQPLGSFLIRLYSNQLYRHHF